MYYKTRQFYDKHTEVTLCENVAQKHFRFVLELEVQQKLMFIMNFESYIHYRATFEDTFKVMLIRIFYIATDFIFIVLYVKIVQVILERMLYNEVNICQ